MNQPRKPELAYLDRRFLDSETARPVRILSEILAPLHQLSSHRVHTTVLFLGSTRVGPDDKSSPLLKYYWEAEELAYLLAGWAIKLKPKGKNFVICTGGGPGIMEAANRGAARAGGQSIGMNISLPEEQMPNSYISPELSFLFHYFFTRKFWLVNKAKAMVAFPGGFGTLDEVFETLTLIQTGKIARQDMAIVLYGEEYWRKTIHFEHLLENRTIAPGDIELFRFCSTPKEAFTFLKRRLKESLVKA
ncbi:MAG: Rossman fold protein, TIGR00730 family [Candidatus Aminicenantes bacterium RBG_16_63_16]|nr:MAG: Rossman fold protein, TIGR00730 family [Candidatus Aminicenantes bacterium RBG_16_63_16]